MVLSSSIFDIAAAEQERLANFLFFTLGLYAIDRLHDHVEFTSDVASSVERIDLKGVRCRRCAQSFLACP